MKFAHIADCHIGGWRDEKLKVLGILAFEKIIDSCVSEVVDFVLISGDLFNSSLPSIDFLKKTVTELKKLKTNGIPCYIIPGSHDFSPSGKTMLSVLEEADLVVNVVKGEVVDDKLKLNFTIDPKTGAKITGMLGKKGMLEKSFYNNLIRENLEMESGFKIFMFHSAITELKPKDLEKMDSMPLSLLPRNFDYYAGGHVHIVEDFHIDGYDNVVYPGPVFPNNFYELEMLKQGGYYIYSDGVITFKPVKIKNVISINLDCTDFSIDEVESTLKEKIGSLHLEDSILTIKLKGKIRSGRVSDINFKEIFHLCYERNVYFVMKNTFQLRNRDFEEIKIEENSVEDVEDKLVKEHAGQNLELGLEVEKEIGFTKSLMKTLAVEKAEDEKNDDYDKRVLDSMHRVIEGL